MTVEDAMKLCEDVRMVNLGRGHMPRAVAGLDSGRQIDNQQTRTRIKTSISCKRERTRSS